MSNFNTLSLNERKSFSKVETLENTNKQLDTNAETIDYKAEVLQG